MRTIFFIFALTINPVLAWAQLPASGQPCQLDRSDFASLKISESRIQSQAEVDALPDWKRALLCSSRNFLREIRANGNRLVGSPAKYSPYYLSLPEKTFVSELVDGYIEKGLGLKP